MKQHTSNEKVRIKLFSGLGRTLAVSFLMFALIPMAAINIISYQNAHNSLREETEIALKTAALLKTKEICTYFDGMLVDLRHQAETRSTISLLNKLTNVYQKSGKPLEEFVKSYRWTMVVDEFASDLKKFRKAYNYHDIFLINNNGAILYSVAGENDLGTNLFTGKNNSSKFTATTRKALKTGKLVFSDYERYGPSKNQVFGFLIYPVLNQDGDRIGAIAFQFPIGPINSIMQAKTELGQTAETYLVGPDLTLRSQSVLDKGKKLIDEKILTTQTKLIKTDDDEEMGIENIGHTASIYQGPHGDQVLGIHLDFLIQNVSFSVIAEISEKEAFSRVVKLRHTMLIMIGLTGIIVTIFSLMLVRHIVRPVLKLSSGAKRVEHGDLTQSIEIISKNEIGDLAGSFNAMVESLKNTMQENALQDWFKTGQMKLSNNITDISDISKLSHSIITFLAKYLEADIGALYIVNDDKCLRLTGSYAFSFRKHLSNEFNFGQGLVGQAALENQRILLTQVPDDYIQVQSGLGETSPRCIVVKPFMYNDKVLGVIELGAIETFSKKALQFLDLVSEHIAIAIQTVIGNVQVQDLLEKTQIQAMELGINQQELSRSNKTLEKQTLDLKKSESSLKAQQKELRRSNQTLEKQTLELKKSEASLQAQQEELRQSNDALSAQSAELEEQAAQLESQKTEIQKHNINLELAKEAIAKKAEDLKVVSKYKSEFLANMSHELRTPLNSILLLSKHLADNKDANMTEKQVECADTVHTSGNELLTLINEVLDLSKVEAGHVVIEPEDTALKDITEAMERNFKAIAEEKGVDLNVNISKEMPEIIRTDVQRLSQILKNLLSNAFKFTDKGSVFLEICRPALAFATAKIDKTAIAFIVKDTGIGIPEDKQDFIFQAFKQADGSTSRNYGGTGLGLSISLEYAKLLGGNLQLSSKEGEGSVFTLCIPETMETINDKATSDEEKLAAAVSQMPAESRNSGIELAAKPPTEIQNQACGVENVLPVVDYIADDRKTITPESRSILIIEDDSKFARILRDVAREKGFKALVAESGETGLHMTDYYSPDGIILDMGLPGIDGQVVISRLKESFSTRHIPVHVVSASDRTFEPMQMGAVGYLTKPVTMEALDDVFGRIEKMLSKKVKEVLLVEDNKAMQKLVTNLIEDDTVKVTVAQTGKEAKNLVDKKNFDCMILDLGLPDMSGTEILTELRMQKDFHIPVIVHTAKDLTPEERVTLDNFAQSIVIKNTKSREKLLDETSLFLHRVEADLPEEKRKLLNLIHDKEAILENKKILVVDDDMRNVFALMSILEDKGAKPIVAKNGKESLSMLKKNPDTDLVLMDIMMPEMDGYEAMEEIRKMEPELSKIPIIALTAKAMKGDRTKCISAGASDYLSKPVDASKLFSMLRVWLY